VWIVRCSLLARRCRSHGIQAGWCCARRARQHCLPEREVSKDSHRSTLARAACAATVYCRASHRTATWVGGRAVVWLRSGSRQWQKAARSLAQHAHSPTHVCIVRTTCLLCQLHPPVCPVGGSLPAVKLSKNLASC
jgi:hypothetical protein